ncbi:MAG TPA: NAD(P)/FAD-dependent oxidoreductase [Pirellulaceae bacterium]|nr:NAD(P)/FAD-dependent oxidoreductase [Pirellulaceae bacterium]
MTTGTERRRRVVIVGGGFGGLETAKRLRKAACDVVLVDRSNHHLFQPLLYQVATGGLSPSNIATPLRQVLRRCRNCRVLLGEVTGFDLERREVLLQDERIPFDDLVVAAGASHSYFGRDEWRQLAPGLKSLGDATEINSRIFGAFERAERETNEERRRALMTFVVVGAGPTGVELAGSIIEIARNTLRNDFRAIRPEETRVVLVEASPRVLGQFPEALSARGDRQLSRLGVEVRTETKVIEITADHVRLEKAGSIEVLATHTVLWAAGVKANPLGARLADACGLATDRAGRVPVDRRLRVAGREELFVIGDLAAATDSDGKPLPGVAPVAIDQGRYVARAIAAKSAGKQLDEPFRYVDKGSMATIGRAAAVARIGKRQYGGWIAWILWLVVHLWQIMLVENRIMILWQWGWNYLTYSRSNRILSLDDVARIERVATRVESVGNVEHVERQPVSMRA